MSENTSPHDGKYFVIQKGKAQCNQGNQFPQFKVTHTRNIIGIIKKGKQII
jgi:hypothetical protein